MLNKGAETLGEIGGKWDFPLRLREKIRCDHCVLPGVDLPAAAVKDSGGISANS